MSAGTTLTLTPGRWEVTTAPVVIDGTHLMYRATLLDRVLGTEASWSAASASAAREAARVAALFTQAAEAHCAGGIETEVLA